MYLIERIAEDDVDSRRQVTITEFSNSSLEIALHLAWKRNNKGGVGTSVGLESQLKSEITSHSHIPKKRRINTAAKTPYFGPVHEGHHDLGEFSKVDDVKKATTNIDKEESYQMVLKLYYEEKARKEEKASVKGHIIRQEIKPHGNLYDILPPFFNEFWDMTFDNRLSVVFFSCITPSNCDKLGLPNYFAFVDEAVTLSNIKVKMDLKHYNTLVEFTADFRTMYQNVFSYFKKDTEEVRRALELKAQCERRRKSAASKLKW